MITDIKIAYSEQGKKSVNNYHNMPLDVILAKLRVPTIGQKDGSNILRSAIKTEDGHCLSRSDINTESLARLLIVDGDSRVDKNGEIIEGAPSPQTVSEILLAKNIFHLIYGSYSHYEGTKGNRYRIILLSQKYYNKSQLGPTVASIIKLINDNLDGDLLFNVSENLTWSIPWYLPRKPKASIIRDLYFEHLKGNFIEVLEPTTIVSPVALKIKSCEFTSPDAFRNFSTFSGEMISPIHAFNQQFPLEIVLSRFGYKKEYETDKCQKWLSPFSTTDEPGITVWGNRFYSHHRNDPMCDEKSHDSFDLFRKMKNLSHRDAIKEVARICKTPDGRSIDEYNKALLKTRACTAR